MNDTSKNTKAPSTYASELGELNRVEVALADLRDKHGQVPDYSTKQGYASGKASIRELTSYRTGTDKARLAITKPHREFIDQVNSYAKGLIGEVEVLEAPHRNAKKEADEAEKREKEERIIRLKERLAKEVTSYLDTAVGMDSSELADLVDAAEKVSAKDYFDITAEAENEAARVVRELRSMHEQALQSELMAQRERELEEERQTMARERAELNRLKEQQAESYAERERIWQQEEARAQAEARAKAYEEARQRAAAEQQAKPPSRINAAVQRGSDVKAPDAVTISRKEYDALLDAQAELDALKAAGVDNWSGYDDAMATLYAA